MYTDTREIACHWLKFRFRWDFRCKLIQDQDLLATNKNLDLDEIWDVKWYNMMDCNTTGLNLALDDTSNLWLKLSNLWLALHVKRKIQWRRKYLKCKLIQDQGLFVTDQDLDLDETSDVDWCKISVAANHNLDLNKTWDVKLCSFTDCSLLNKI